MCNIQFPLSSKPESDFPISMHSIHDATGFYLGSTRCPAIARLLVEIANQWSTGTLVESGWAEKILYEYFRVDLDE